MEFQEFHKWALKELGINLEAYKQEQLTRRIKSLMERVGVSNLKDYSQLITKDKIQREKFLDFITINVTEFFRNAELFKELEFYLKTQLLIKNKSLKIWSAACSIGCEPYSLAMILAELNPTGRHKIVATDIDDNILRRAKEGVYTEGEVKNVTKEYLNKYFTLKERKFYIKDNIKKMVELKKHDLILNKYETDFDLIVCRNVVIYFKEDIKRKIFSDFYKSLNPGGILFVGATESIYNYREYGFDKVSTFIYKKI